MEFNVLLLLSTTLGDLYYNGVCVKFLPSNTTSLILQIDQGVICAFKALYTCNSLQHLVREINMDEDFSFKEYSLKMFTIASCLTIIG